MTLLYRIDSTRTWKYWAGDRASDKIADAVLYTLDNLPQRFNDGFTDVVLEGEKLFYWNKDGETVFRAIPVGNLRE